jgi:cell wall-associated NlpC family hydrolase
VHPGGLDGPRVRDLLKEAGTGSLAERMDRISAALVGRPYRSQPLDGGPGQREVFTAALDGFDCVTFVETVLALGRARDVAEFERTLRRLRYRSARPSWPSRNHYMTGWARANAAHGLLRDLTRGPDTVVKERHLTVVPGIAAERGRFRCFPKRALPRLASRLQTGDILLFASTRSDLDVFHVGVLVRQGGELRLRHAARSRGRVVDEPLRHFVAEHRMAGLLVLRPRRAVRRSSRAA